MPRVSDFERFVFVVGAPRCGTTTIAKLLKRQPRISFSLVKEPHFFSRHDLRDLSDDALRQRVEDEYLAHFFAPVEGGQSIGAEGSVSYLYTPEQMEPILRLWPESRFIIAVRDPLTLLPSLHQRLIYIGDETLSRFEDAWAATPARAAGHGIPRSCLEPRWLRYDQAGRLGSYVERFFSAVGRERCLVVVFDDLVDDPRREFRRILQFAGVRRGEIIDVPVSRESRVVRYPALQRLLKRPPRPLWAYLASHQHRLRFNGTHRLDLEDVAVDKVLSVRKRLLRWNRTSSPPPPVPLQVQQQIRGHFKDDIDRLASLIGRDLGHWLQPADGSSSDASP